MSVAYGAVSCFEPLIDLIFINCGWFYGSVARP